MKLIKKFIYLLVFVLLFKNVSANPLISLQNCADAKELNEQLKSLDKMVALNSYDVILKEHMIKLNEHKLNIKIIEEELDYLSKINFIELQNKYLENSLDISYLTVLFRNSSQVLKWGKLDPSLRLEKRILSDFFKDYKKTKKSLEAEIKTQKNLKTSKENKINKIKKMGQEKYNIFLDKKINEKKNFLKNLIAKNLDDKMLNKSYNNHFFECEKIRVIAPMTFDYKWK